MKQPNFLQKLFGGKTQEEPRESRRFQIVEAGSSGTEIYSGYFSEEYLPELTGRKAAEVYDKMRRNDADVVMVMASVKGPILRANWEVEAASQSPEHLEQKEFIEHLLFKDQANDWEDFLGEALTMVDFGHAVFEVTHKAVIDHKKFGSYIGLKKLGWRSPRTIERWNLSLTGDLLSITQYAYGDLDRKIDIDGRFLLTMALQKEGDNYEGISRLRGAYGAWWRKQLYLKLMAIGSEKYAVPTPILTVPKGAQNTEQEANAKAALEAYSSNESQFLSIPEGWKIDFLKSDFDPEKVKICVEYEGTQIARSCIMQFLLLGSSGSSGSWALSTDLSDFSLGAIEYVADRIASPFNKKLIPALIEMKYGKQSAYPTLKHSGIDDKAGKELSEVLKNLYESRALEPDLDLETHLRRRYGLPKKGNLDVRRKPASEDTKVGERTPAEPTSAGIRSKPLEGQA